MRVALLFTDGVGMGPSDPERNPLARGDFLLSQFLDGPARPLPDGGAVHPVDTTFGVPGRPQSASNQTAIYTGLAAPRLLGQHVPGYPSRALRALLEEHSLVLRLARAGRSATFANAYPVTYLDALHLPHLPAGPETLTIPDRTRRRLRASASTLAMAAARVPLRTLDDARAGRGLTHDLGAAAGGRRRLATPRRTATEAAEIFWALAADFTLFEHFLADEAGHQRDAAAAADALGTFDAFARAVVARRPPDACVLITSDHGNVEDLAVRTHTLNPVAVLAFGVSAGLPPLRTVADVGLAALALLGVAGSP
jgi:Metalloenzyme superfamily